MLGVNLMMLGPKHSKINTFRFLYKHLQEPICTNLNEFRLWSYSFSNGSKGLKYRKIKWEVLNKFNPSWQTLSSNKNKLKWEFTSINNKRNHYRVNNWLFKMVSLNLRNWINCNCSIKKYWISRSKFSKIYINWEI